MANILIREIPEDVYQRFADMAQKDKRSIPAEALFLIEREIDIRSARLQDSRRAVGELATELKNRKRLPVSAAELVREVRDEE